MDYKKMSTGKSESKWEKVAIGGVSGIMIGAASALALNTLRADANTGKTSRESTNDDDADVEEAGVPMATTVDDSMSFSDAFNAAREEVGPGGAFEWHGNVYVTYTADEWSSLGPEGRAEFTESIPWDGPTRDYTPQSQSSHSSSSQADQTSHGDSSQNTSHTTGGHTTSGQTTGGNSDDLDVEIIGVEHVDLDGVHDSVVGTVSVDGQEVYFVDIDGEDDEFDVMIADVNGNNAIEENEIIDISEQHISVSNFEQEALAQQNDPSSEEPVQYYADNENLPDYVNDADPGTLA